ncbi:MAG: GGDEF-domain containing protein, partial [Gammaproteobacteria bacterium HGW-Gammaproteobacteria-10]
MRHDSGKGAPAYPDHIEDLRVRLMNQLFSLLESQTRTRSFASSISALVRRVHGEILANFEQVLARIDDPVTVAMFRKAITDCQSLDMAFEKLVDERQRQWYKNGKYLKSVVDEL